MPLWEDPKYDDEVYRAAEIWVSEIKKFSNGLNKGNSLEFVNYAAPFQDPMTSYGKRNFRFLKDVSRKYDPNRVFQKLVPGGYKL